MRTDQGKGVGKDRHWFGHRDEKTKTMLVVVRVITAPDWSMLLVMVMLLVVMVVVPASQVGKETWKASLNWYLLNLLFSSLLCVCVHCHDEPQQQQ